MATAARDMATAPMCLSGVDYRGYCASASGAGALDTAIWCDPSTGQTFVVDCAARGQICQIDVCADGAYCCDGSVSVDMAPPASTAAECDALGYAGACTSDGHARWCADGQIVDIDCGARGQSCAVDSCTTGALLLRRMSHVLAAALAVATGCAAAGDAATVTAVAGREDLTLLSLRAHVAGGLSAPVAFELPDGVTAVLIEVAGERGQFHLAGLQTPSGRDAVESGGFVTRDAREVDGLVDWLYPNSPSLAAESGRYVLRFTALDGGGAAIDDEDVTVRLYARAGAAAGGAFKLDVLVADDALDAGSVDELAAALVERMGRLYAQAGLAIADYTAAPVTFGDACGGRRPCGRRLGRLARSTAGGSALRRSCRCRRRCVPPARGRTRCISWSCAGSTTAAATWPAIRSGCPDRSRANRPTAAVLVSAAPFAGAGGALDSDDMAVTCAHEIGHYLGLYHTSEKDGADARSHRRHARVRRRRPRLPRRLTTSCSGPAAARAGCSRRGRAR